MIEISFRKIILSDIMNLKSNAKLKEMIVKKKIKLFKIENIKFYFINVPRRI